LAPTRLPQLCAELTTAQLWVAAERLQKPPTMSQKHPETLTCPLLCSCMAILVICLCSSCVIVELDQIRELLGWMTSVNSFNFKIIVAVDSMLTHHSSSERGFHLESNKSLLLLGKVNKSFSKKIP
jgi:hypothetical protein